MLAETGVAISLEGGCNLARFFVLQMTLTTFALGLALWVAVLFDLGAIL